MCAPGPGAYDHPHFDDADAADAYWERDARIFEPSEQGQPHVDPDAPLFVDDVPTKRVRTPSDAELVAELDQHAEYGTGETAPITHPWPVRR